MAQVSGPGVLELFKNVYGELKDALLPDRQPLQKALPFNQMERVGEAYIIGVVLTHEVGITMSSSGDLFDLNPAIAGVVKQASVSPYITVLPSVLPWSMASRSVGSAQSFFNASKFLVKNNLRSHMKFQEILRLYGQSAALLGYVSYATATYRNASFTNGTGTLVGPNGTTYAFTNGVNTSDKLILLAPGQFASGFWVAMEGVKVLQVNAAGTTVASGKLVSVNNDLGFIEVDFTPVAASSTTSHRLCYEGMQNGQDYPGIQKILSTRGNLFGINTNAYSLWQGNTNNLSSTKFTLQKYNTAIGNLVNVSGLEGDLVTYLNPRSWATITNDASGTRVTDSSYKPSEYEDGFDSVKFYSQNGTSTFIAHRCVKEGDAFTLHLPNWSRSGSSEVSFSIPGGPNSQDMIFPLENQAGWAFRSYSDQFIFCDQPSCSLYTYGINDESTT